MIHAPDHSTLDMIFEIRTSKEGRKYAVIAFYDEDGLVFEHYNQDVSKALRRAYPNLFNSSKSKGEN